MDGTGRENLIIIKISQKHSSKETVEDNIFSYGISLFLKKLGSLSQLVQDLYQNNGLDWYSNQDMLDSYQRRRTQPN